MASNDIETLGDHSIPMCLSKWITLPLKRLLIELRDSPAVIIDHYLIVFVHQVSSRDPPEDDPEEDEFNKLEVISNTCFVLAVDLRDNSIQKAELGETFGELMDYTLTKYKDNQIIKFGGGYSRHYRYGSVFKITVESFEPFSVKCLKFNEDHFIKDHPKLGGATAQIYRDRLYIFGGINEYRRTNDLWSFNLENATWKLCETTGEAPARRVQANSSVIGDNLFIYGGECYKDESENSKHIFVLNFNSMNWTRIEQTEKYLLRELSLYNNLRNGHVYKDHLIILANEEQDRYKPKRGVVCCWNPEKNTWSKSYIEGEGLLRFQTDLVIYKDLLITIGGDEKTRIVMATLKLGNLGLLALHSQEEKRFFMSETESDISFKVEEKIIPAHKKILIDRSRYFVNLFKSDMMESRQEIIEIPDCEYHVFREYLRFIYYHEAQIVDLNLAIKLFQFADKYLQDDLSEKCVDFFTYGLASITSDDVEIILGLLHQEIWCITFFNNNLEVNNLSGLIQYLSQENTPDGKVNDYAFNFVMKNISEIFKDDNMNTSKLCEDFLIKNITIDTVLRIVHVMYDNKERSNTSKKIPQEKSVNLKKACFDFAKNNFKTLQENNIPEKLPNTVLSELIFYLVETVKQFKKKMISIKLFPFVQSFCDLHIKKINCSEH